MKISRRQMLAAGLGCAAAAMLPGSLRAEEDKTLATAGEAIGLDVGSALGQHASTGVKEVVARECTRITPENVMKPMHISPREGVWRFQPVHRTYEFAREHGLKVHGHTLVWDKEPAIWQQRLAEGKSLDEVTAIYGDYIQTIIREFPDTASWDVLNEIFEQRGLRETVPLGAHGLDFVERCLRAAREAAPDATLVINDFNLTCAGHWCDDKRRNVLDYYRRLLDRGAPIDAIGLQAHLKSLYPPSGRKTLAFIREAEAMGLQVYLSELDVNDSEWPQDIARRDELVARMYGDFLGEVLRSKAVTSISFWGITDADNWIVRPTFGEEKIQGAPPRPTLFDPELNRKPSYYAVLNAIEQAPPRIELITARQAQQALTELGFNPGPVDGAWGRRSQGALNALRAERGLPEVATLDLPSQRLLMELANLNQ